MRTTMAIRCAAAVALLLLASCEGDGGVSCGEGTEARDGACVPVDAPVRCGDGTLLVEGACVPKKRDPPCGDGTVALDGECVPEWDGLACGPGTHAEEEGCVPDAPPRWCGAGTHAEGDGCVADAEPVTCGAGTHEEDGVCVPDDPPLVCERGYHEEDGACVVDPLPEGVAALAGSDWALPFDDLAPFGAVLGDTPVVALGESVHTSGGYSAMKVRLFRYLVEAHGFRVFAFESPRTAAEQTAAYVAGCVGTPEDAARGLFGVWANTSVRDVLAWMCAWNRDHAGDPVHFFGFDVQQPWDDAPALRDFLERAAPGVAADLDAGIASCNGAAYASADAYYADPAASDYEKEDYEACAAGLDALGDFLVETKGTLVAETSEDDWELARLAWVGLRSWQEELFFLETDVPRSYEARDEAMADVFLTLRGLRYAEQKSVLWAHNFHIAHAYERARGGLGGVRDMGSALRDALGDDYAAVALVGYQVEINWPGVGTGPLETPTRADAVETILHGLGPAFLFVDLAFPGAAEPLLARDASYWFEGEAVRFVPAQQYRAIVFLDHSPPMDALFW